MALQLGDEAPDFIAESTKGEIHFYEWKGDSWALLFSHPGDFTPVCTTELAAAAALKPEFDKRNTKLIATSVDSLDTHYRWLSDIKDVSGTEVDFPIIEDPNRWVASLYGMIHPKASGRETARSAFIVGPDNKVELMLVYPPSTGRNFRELLRVIDSLQLAAQHGVSTPADWQDGQDVIIPIEVSDEQAWTRFPKGFAAKKPYLRMTRQPER